MYVFYGTQIRKISVLKSFLFLKDFYISYKESQSSSVIPVEFKYIYHISWWISLENILRGNIILPRKIYCCRLEDNQIIDGNGNAAYVCIFIFSSHFNVQVHTYITSVIFIFNIVVSSILPNDYFYKNKGKKGLLKYLKYWPI